MIIRYKQQNNSANCYDHIILPHTLLSLYRTTPNRFINWYFLVASQTRLGERPCCRPQFLALSSSPLIIFIILLRSDYVVCGVTVVMKSSLFHWNKTKNIIQLQKVLRRKCYEALMRDPSIETLYPPPSTSLFTRTQISIFSRRNVNKISSKCARKRGRREKGVIVSLLKFYEWRILTRPAFCAYTSFVTNKRRRKANPWVAAKRGRKKLNIMSQ